MRQFHTVVLERMTIHSQDFSTEAYETAWASEAIFFIRVHSISGSETSIDSRVQLSVDGIDWVDDDTKFPIIRKEGSYLVRVRHFGGWLRLRNVIKGKDPALRLTVYLVLKE